LYPLVANVAQDAFDEPLDTTVLGESNLVE